MKVTDYVTSHYDPQEPSKTKITRAGKTAGHSFSTYIIPNGGTQAYPHHLKASVHNAGRFGSLHTRILFLFHCK